ncbi:MAG: site-2 protease family protein [Archangium sp.]
MSVLFPFIAFQFVTAAWITVQLLIARSVRVRPTQVSLGMGPRVFKKKFGEVEWQFGLFPTGGYVQLHGMADFPPRLGAFVALVPWLLIGAVTFACGARLDDFLAGFTVLVRLPEIFANWALWYPQFLEAPRITGAQLAARLVAVNLLPLPSLAGWTIVRLLLPKQFHERAAVPMLIVVVIAVVLLNTLR